MEDTFYSKEQLEYEIEKIREVAGKDLTRKILDFFDDESKVIYWFYSNSKALGDKSPSDYCLQKDFKTIEDELGRMEHGIFS